MLKKTLTTRTKAAKESVRRAHAEKNAALEDELRTKKERVRTLKRAVDKPKLIGSAEELIPFSWRYPLSEPEDAKMTKVYREVVALEKALTIHKDNR